MSYFIKKRFFSQPMTCRRFIGLLIATSVLASCNKEGETIIQGEEEGGGLAKHTLGWDMSKEDKEKYPRNISFGFANSGSSSSLPSKVDLTSKLPPAGNQGNYGTCVTWSVGYGMRSYLNAVTYGLTTQQLTETRNQFSPADLWMSMKTKNANCGGANFEPAFDVLVSRGITTLQTAPYSNLQCGGSSPQSWATDAAKYKILNYRMIADADMTVANLKSLLSQGRLISFGARLGDNFLSWKGSGVLSSETYIQPDSKNAYHAMVVAGYDDSKGSKGAFLVYNSWGSSWGDRGCIWVDYNFFFKDFVFIAFVATADNNVNPNDKKEIDPKDQTSGADLAAYNAYDIPDTEHPGYNRQVCFNVYNIGKSPVVSSNKWRILYIYYNAFNANEWGVLAELYFTNEIARGQVVQRNEAYNSIGINKDIPAGKNISAVVFDQPTYNYVYMWYNLPKITGYYYLVMWADPFDCVKEDNKQNNAFFIASTWGIPYYFQNGKPSVNILGTYASGESVSILGARHLEGKMPLHSPITDQTRNTYTTDEISQMLMSHKQSGELEKKVNEFNEKQAKPAISGGEAQ